MFVLKRMASVGLCCVSMIWITMANAGAGAGVGGATTTSTFMFASADQATTTNGCQIEGAYPTFVRSGAPPKQTSATLVLKLAPSTTITGVGFAYKYVTGYSGTVGANFTLKVAGTDVYRSPVLNTYPYAKRTVYSPPVGVAATMLNVAVPVSGGDVAFKFDNIDKNIQLELPMQINITCTGVNPCFTGPAPPPPPPSGCSDFSGIWFNHPDPINSIKYNLTQASGSCVVKGLHDCQFHNDSLAIGDVLHWCENKMAGTLKLDSPLDKMKWSNGASWYREHKH